MRYIHFGGHLRLLQIRVKYGSLSFVFLTLNITVQTLYVDLKDYCHKVIIKLLSDIFNSTNYLYG